VSPAKKNDRVAPPAQPGRWLLRFGSNEAAKGWEDLAQQTASNLWDAYEAIRTEPAPFPPTSRQHRLKGDLGTVSGLEQWQYEVTAGGRSWYLVDPEKKTVWIRYASTKHPKATDR
jgi:CubicO group peptidase (beta-lactamase class C family)